MITEFDRSREELGMERSRPGRNIVLVFTASLSLLPALSIAAAPSEIEQSIQERREKFVQMGEAYDEIDRELKNREPDLAMIQRHAVQIDDWAGDQIHWFPEGSGPESGIETEARAEIWSDAEQFEALQEAFVLEARRFKDAAGQGDLANLMSRFEATSAVCSECHEKYRKESSIFSIFGF